MKGKWNYNSTNINDIKTTNITDINFKCKGIIVLTKNDEEWSSLVNIIYPKYRHQYINTNYCGFIVKDNSTELKWTLEPCSLEEIINTIEEDGGYEDVYITLDNYLELKQPNSNKL